MEGWEQTETEGQFEFRARKKKKLLFFARSLALQESQIASVSWYPLLFLPFLCCNLAPSFLSFILFFFSLFVVRGTSHPR